MLLLERWKTVVSASSRRWAVDLKVGPWQRKLWFWMRLRHVFVQAEKHVDEFVLDYASRCVVGSLRVMDTDIVEDAQRLEPVATAMRARGSQGRVVVLADSLAKALPLGLADVQDRGISKPPPG